MYSKLGLEDAHGLVMNIAVELKITDVFAAAVTLRLLSLGSFAGAASAHE